MKRGSLGHGSGRRKRGYLVVTDSGSSYQIAMKTPVLSFRNVLCYSFWGNILL